MNQNYQEFYWNKLDNAAKMYSAVSREQATNVFRLSVQLSSPVEPDTLQTALEQALRDMPSFQVKLRKGLFWHYFETNFAAPRVRQDYTYPCAKIDRNITNGYLFRLTYFSCHVHLDMYHVLADGSGALQFLKLILAYYLEQQHPGTPFAQLLPDGEWGFSRGGQEENSFLHYRAPQTAPSSGDGTGPVGSGALGAGAEASAPAFVPKEQPKTASAIPKGLQAYRIEGVKVLGGELKMITGVCSAKGLIGLVKAAKKPVTAYLTALLIYSIYRQSFQYHQQNRPVSVCVPVNLRNFFPSSTLRNFFSNVSVTLDLFRKNPSFEEILEQTTDQLAKKQESTALEAKMKGNAHVEQSMLIRIIPLFLKRMVLGLMYRKNDKLHTSSLSNLGRIVLPEEFAPYVLRFEAHLPVSPRQPVKLGVCSYGDNMAFTFSCALEETDIPQFFFRFLQQQGLEITIGCNEPAAADTSAEPAKKERRKRRKGHEVLPQMQGEN